MIRKALAINTDSKKIYRHILSSMNFLLNLTPQERNVLAEIIRLNNEYEPLPIKQRTKFILSTAMRKEISENIKINPKSFNGLLHRLRDKKLFNLPILDENNYLHPALDFKPDKEGFQFIMTLQIKEENKIENENQVEVEDKNENETANTKETIVPPDRENINQNIPPPSNNGIIVSDGVDNSDIEIL